jgi:hypothetical protein
VVWFCPATTKVPMNEQVGPPAPTGFTDDPVSGTVGPAEVVQVVLVIVPFAAIETLHDDQPNEPPSWPAT